MEENLWLQFISIQLGYVDLSVAFIFFTPVPFLFQRVPPSWGAVKGLPGSINNPLIQDFTTLSYIFAIQRFSIVFRQHTTKNLTKVFVILKTNSILILVNHQVNSRVPSMFCQFS